MQTVTVSSSTQDETININSRNSLQKTSKTQKLGQPTIDQIYDTLPQKDKLKQSFTVIPNADQSAIEEELKGLVTEQIKAV